MGIIDLSSTLNGYYVLPISSFSLSGANGGYLISPMTEGTTPTHDGKIFLRVKNTSLSVVTNTTLTCNVIYVAVKYHAA